MLFDEFVDFLKASKLASLKNKLKIFMTIMLFNQIDYGGETLQQIDQT